MPIFNCFIAIESSKSTNTDHSLPWHYIKVIQPYQIELHETEVSSRLEALFLITHINKTNTDRARISRCGQGAMSCYYCYYCYMQLIHNIHAYNIVSYRRPHNHEGNFVESKVDFYVSKLK